MAILFWFSFAVIAYVYAGYPVLLRLSAFGRPRSVNKVKMQPFVSVIVAARNEESTIEAKLENLLASEYPAERIEILVGSDGSSDRTNEFVARSKDRGVRLISFSQQVGKSAIQNALVAASLGSILIFTDADCLFSSQTLPLLISNFAEPATGLVTVRPRYVNAVETEIAINENLYLDYETWIRMMESERGMLAMASGSLLAMRRSLWQPLERNFGEDFVLALAVCKSGHRNVLDTDAIVHTRLSQTDPESMLQMKIRIISKDFCGLLANSCLLNPLQYGRIAVALWSHKLLRWLIPYFLIVLTASNLFLLGKSVFRWTLFLQMSFYTLAAIGYLFRNRRFLLTSIPFSFCLVNFAALLGTLAAAWQMDQAKWDPLRAKSPVG